MSGNGDIDPMKVKTMIMIAAICFAVIPMILFTTITGNMVRSDGESMFNDELKNMAAAQTNSLKTLSAKVHADLDTLAAFPGVKEFGRLGEFKKQTVESTDNALNRYMADSKINSISLVDANGKIIAGSDKDSDYPEFASYADYEDGVLYFDLIAAKNTNSKNTMFIKSKMDNATLFLSYNLSGSDSLLARITSDISFYDNGRVVIIDSKNCWSSGTVINENLDSFAENITAQLNGLNENQPTETFIYKEGGKDTSGILVKAEGADGLVSLISCPNNRANFFTNKSLTPITSVAVLLAVLSIVAAILISQNVTKPLSKIEDTLAKIRRGDHEARIGTIANNEYGQLSRAFNNVIDEIVVSEDRYKTISEMSDNIIFEWNFKTNDVTFSNNFNKKFSYRPPSDHFGDSFLMKAKLHPDDDARYRTDLDRLEKGKNFENNEYRIKNIYGDFIWILIRTATLNDADGHPLKAVGVMVDIDRAKKSEAKLTEQASFDALTELYNRETIESQIDNEISLSEMRKSEMAVLFIDVDDFKHYNDNYSHATGDQVLKFLAKTIKETVEGIGFAGRYGGDEFIAMIRNAESNDPAKIAQTLINKLADGFDADIGERLSVSVSIGIAVIKDDYNTRVEYLIGKADDAMYSVKKSGKANYAFI